MTCEIVTSFDPYLSKLYNLVNVYNPTTLYLISPYPDVHKKIDEFKEGLIMRGIRPPKFFVANVDTTDLKYGRTIDGSTSPGSPKLPITALRDLGKLA